MRCQHFELDLRKLLWAIDYYSVVSITAWRLKKHRHFSRSCDDYAVIIKNPLNLSLKKKFIFRAMFISIQHSHNIIYKRYSLPFNTQLIISVLHVILIYYSEIYTYNSVHLLLKLQEIIGFSFELLPYLSLNCSNKIK